MKVLRTTSTLFLLTVFLGTGISVLAPNAAHAASTASMSTWIKGASITPDTSTQFASASFEQSLVNLKAMNANSVSFVIPLTQTSVTSTDIGPAVNTPTDASLIAAIQEAHALGLSVTLKPHLDTQDGQWRAYINPVGASARAAWFAAYDSEILHYAALAQANHVEMIVIGTELIDMSSDNVNATNTANWLSLISQVRAIYTGKLTYAANWGGSTWADEKDNIKFWNALDYAGIDAYYPLGTTSSSNSVSALLADWNQWGPSFTTFAASVGKPVLFTEVGYRSTTGDHGNSDDYSYSNGYDGTEQANDYAALFQYWSSNPYLAGMSLWQWDPSPTAGGAGDLNYTPQNKPAQAVMTAWLGGVGVPYSAPNVLLGAGISSTTIAVNQPITLTAQVTNTGGAISNGIIDLEVYNASGTQVYQSFAQNQTLGATMVPYSVSWTPPSAGVYTVKVGAFSGDWSANYAWDNQAEIITVTAPAPVVHPTSAPVIIDVWWPTTNTTISGTLPFKAMVENMSVNAYTMYWQVDGGALNGMYISNTDYPHYEQEVDVSGWNWRGTGPYQITFVAKNSSGTTIGTQTIPVMISS